MLFSDDECVYVTDNDKNDNIIFYSFYDIIDDSNEIPVEPVKLIVPSKPTNKITTFKAKEPTELYENIKWSNKILELKTRDLNIYIKKNKLNAYQISSLKSQRRKMLNRFYARNYRANKKQ